MLDFDVVQRTVSLQTLYDRYPIGIHNKIRRTFLIGTMNGKRKDGQQPIKHNRSSKLQLTDVLLPIQGRYQFYYQSMEPRGLKNERFNWRPTLRGFKGFIVIEIIYNK